MIKENALPIQLNSIQRFPHSSSSWIIPYSWCSSLIPSKFLSFFFILQHTDTKLAPVTSKSTEQTYPIFTTTTGSTEEKNFGDWVTKAENEEQSCCKILNLQNLYCYIRILKISNSTTRSILREIMLKKTFELCGRVLKLN